MFVLLIFSSCNCFYKVWGGKIGIAISVCLSLCAIVSSPYISYGETLKVLLHTKIVMIWGCSWFDPMSFGHVKGHQKKKAHDLCLHYTSLVEKHRMFCLSEDSVILVKYFFYLFTENEKRCLQYSQSWTISSKIIRNNSEFLLFWTMIIKVYPRFFVKKPSKQKCYIHKHVNVNIYQIIFAHNTIAICQKKLFWHF